MAPNDGKDDPEKVKRLLAWAAEKSVGAATDADAPPIDAETRMQLEKWFGLPSYENLEERGLTPMAPPEELDPEIAVIQERRAKAIAAIDPGMLAAHRARVERCDTMMTFAAKIDVRVDPSVALLDLAMIERVGSIADPRELELSEELRDDLRDCTPQALLRDLHRVETDFEKQFEIIDMAAEQKLDPVAAVEEAMKFDLRLPRLDASPFTQGCVLVAEARALRSVAWTDIPMPNRRVKE